MSMTDRLTAPGAARTRLLGVLVVLTVVDAALCIPVSRAALDHSLSWAGAAVDDLAWPVLAVILTCSAGHYVAAAAATRAATRQRLDGRETLLAQLCAASANKLTPAGLGGSAVLARYLCRRTEMSVAAAAGTVTTIALGRAGAALLTLGAMAVVGAWMGFTGGEVELRRLFVQLDASLRTHSWMIPALAAVVAVAALVVIRARARLRAFTGPLREIARRPASAIALLTASAAQTLMLGIAFAAAVHVLPGVHPGMGIGALVAGYIVASAAAAAVPVPGGLGSTEAALTAVLVGGHLGLSHALAAVAVFRVTTLWLPALAGLPSARVLRRRAAL